MASLWLISPLLLVINDERIYQIIITVAIAWILTNSLNWPIFKNQFLVFIGDRSYSFYLAYWIYSFFIKKGDLNFHECIEYKNFYKFFNFFHFLSCSNCKLNEILLLQRYFEKLKIWLKSEAFTPILIFSPTILWQNFEHFSDLLDAIFYTTFIALFFYEYLEKYFIRSSDNVCFAIIFVSGILSAILILSPVMLSSCTEDLTLNTSIQFFLENIPRTLTKYILEQ